MAGRSSTGFSISNVKLCIVKLCKLKKNYANYILLIANAHQSYVNIDSTTYTEHLQEINATLTCHIIWRDSLHYELKVKKVTGSLKRSLQPGDKIEIEISKENV